MTDHGPTGMDIVLPGYLDYIITKTQMIGRDQSSDGYIGDSRHQSRHSWHTHYYVDDVYLSWIREAEMDVREAHTVPAGWARHATVKTARDELRRLRKAYVRRMGWHQ